MRRALVVIHRWLGLFTAVFLIVAGASGALIAWDHELDEWLNPELFELPPRMRSRRRRCSPASNWPAGSKREIRRFASAPRSSHRSQDMRC